jgi:CCDC81 eukaryotic HU domain 2
MMYCNAGPIASACYLSRISTQSAIEALVTAIGDLTTLGYDLNLDFGFAGLFVRNKNLTMSFDDNFVASLNQPHFETKVIIYITYRLKFILFFTNFIPASKEQNKNFKFLEASRIDCIHLYVIP